MLELKKEMLGDREKWESAYVNVPDFDYEAMVSETIGHPVWVHFGAGNIFRGFIARLQNTLLSQGKAKCGIIACEAFDYDVIEKIYRPYDNLALSIGLRPDGTMEKTLVASIAASVEARPDNLSGMEDLRTYFRNPSLQMVTFTITETGYRLTDNAGELFPAVRHDMEHLPDEASHTMGIVTALLYERYRSGAFPIAMVSMDNCTQNGAKLETAVTGIAHAWIQNGFADAGFAKYLENKKSVSFPWSMIDKITPMPADKVREALEADGIRNIETIHTEKKTVIAPFVNAEIPEYLVVEDCFPNGRPKLEDAGVHFTDRETVNKSERMKVTACLNPLMSALGIFGCLLNFESLADEMEDPDLLELVNRLGKREGMPIVEDPGIIRPENFLEEVLTKRLPNRYIPDTPQRTAIDISQKMPNRFGQIIKAYREREELDVDSLVCVPLVIAGWCRYLLAVDDRGDPFQLSRDPMAAELTAYLNGITLGEPATYHDQLRPILSNSEIFTMNLYETCLADKVTEWFRAMLEGFGSVRKTLHTILAETGGTR